MARVLRGLEKCWSTVVLYCASTLGGGGTWECGPGKSGREGQSHARAHGGQCTILSAIRLKPGSTQATILLFQFGTARISHHVDILESRCYLPVKGVKNFLPKGHVMADLGDQLRNLFPAEQLQALDSVRAELLSNPKALDNTNRPEDETA